MKDSTRDGLIEEIAHETAHFTAAPAAFFDAWKRGVALAGTHLIRPGNVRRPCARDQRVGPVSQRGIDRSRYWCHEFRGKAIPRGARELLQRG